MVQVFQCLRGWDAQELIFILGNWRGKKSHIDGLQSSQNLHAPDRSRIDSRIPRVDIFSEVHE